MDSRSEPSNSAITRSLNLIETICLSDRPLALPDLVGLVERGDDRADHPVQCQVLHHAS